MKTPAIILLISFTACTEFASGGDTCFDFVSVAPRDPGRVQYTVPVVDFDTQLTSPTPVAGAEIKVCTNATCIPEFPLCVDDTLGQCYREYPGPVPALRVLDFPFGISNVTLRLSADGYIPTDYPMGGPLLGSPDGALSLLGVGIVLVKTETYAALQAQVGAAPDPARGTLAVRVLGCDLTRAAGVNVEPYNANLSGASSFALSNNNLASSANLQTDARGVVGFFNLLPQTIDVEIPAWDIPPATFNIRSGTLTLAELRWGLDQFGQ